MFSKFNLSRTRIVILTLACTIVCAVAALVAFQQRPAQKGSVRYVDITPRPNESSATEVKGGADGSVALRVAEASKPLKQKTHGSQAAEAPTGASLINPFGVKSLSNNRGPASLPAEKLLEQESNVFNQWLQSPLDETTTSAGISDLMSSLLATSTGSGQESQRKREKEHRGDNPDGAVEFRNLQMQDENGVIPLDGLQKAREQMSVMRAAQQMKAKAAGKPNGIEVAAIIPGAWAWLGPGNVGGRIRTIVIDPVDPNKMWVGSVSGGIWRTTNAGVSWEPVNDFMANLAVSTIVMDPTNSNIMYAGTGESFAADLTATEGQGITPEGLRGDGIFKTTDGGVTWNQLPLTRTADPVVCGGGGISCPWSYVNRLAMSPDGSTILAATNNGIWRSTNGGANWNSNGTFVPLGTNAFEDIDFDPTNSQLAIAAAKGNASYSTDGGQTFIAANYSTDGGVTFNAAITGRVEIAYAPSNPLIVYASVNQSSGVAPNQTLGDVFRSGDGGRNYIRLNAINPGNTFLGTQGNYDNIIWVNPQDPTFVIIGGINMYVSRDSGINWTGIANGANGSAHSDHQMVVAHPGFNNTTNKVVYFSNDGGIYRADDVSTVSLTSGWTKLNNNLGVTQFYGAAANANGVIVGGTQDNGNLRFTGNFNAWSEVTGMGGDGGYVAADPADANYFYGQYIYLQLSRSTDEGQSGGNIFNGIADAGDKTPAAQTSNFIAPFILDPNNPNTMLAGGMSLWRSTDVKAATPTWTAIKPPSPNGLIPPTNIPISAIAVSPSTSDFIVVGDNTGRIYLAFNGTDTNPVWARISNATTPNRFVTRLVIDNTRSPNWIYATFGGFAGNNVYVTKDLGSTWTDVSGAGATGLPSVPVRSLVLNPVRPDLLYVGTEVGVFASEDAGATWSLPQEGPANVSVDELFWLKGDLIAVTHGRGLYKTASPVFGAPVCVPPTNPVCSCFGQWDCPCTWNLKRVPTINDDIAISCAVHLKPGVSSGGSARNMAVYNSLTLDLDLGASQDIINFGIIQSSTGVVSFMGSRHLTNLGFIRLREVAASGDVTNAKSMSLDFRLQSNNLTTSPGSILELDVLTVRGDLENFGRIEARGTGGIVARGDVNNGGSLKAPNFSVAGVPAAQHDFRGQGVWQFGALAIPGGVSPQIVSLVSDVKFDVADFNNNGTLDVRDRTLNFTGGRFQSVDGAVLGSGTFRFAPASGSAIFASSTTNFTAGVTIASGTVEFQAGGSVGELIVDPGATLAMNSGALTVNNNVVNDGAITRLSSSSFNFNGQTFTNNGSVGSIDFLTFNNSGAPKTQFIAGSGSWAPQNVAVGGGPPSSGTVTLQNDLTFGVSNQLLTSTGSALNTGGKTLTLTGPLNFFGGRILGTGLVKMQPSSGTARISGPLTIDPDLEIASGTVKGNVIIANGKLKIDAGATLSLFGPVEANGDFENNGTLNEFSDNPSFKFKGSTFTNNGVVTGNVFVNFGDFGPPLVQNLAGTGSWAGSPRLFISSLSTTTLLNDVTYNGGNLFVEGRINTGAFTLSLPCNVIWGGAGDVIGNVRRTNFAACPGAAIAYGNPFTTIQFTSGTPPTEVLVNIGLGAPAGFLNAARRTYFITPTGGSGYTATLRLHYLDSELNGNAESTLELWRNNGSNWTPQGATNRNTTQNWVEYNNVTQFSPWTISGPNTPTAAPATISGQITTPDGQPLAGVTMNLSGAGTAKTITDSNGNYQFLNVETGGFYTVRPALVNHYFSPAERSFSLLANVTNAVFNATREVVIAGNAIDTPEYFVRQHYLDFLNREPDDTGFNFWSDQMLECGNDSGCFERRRINVSAAYFLSIEFQRTGGLVDGLYRASYGRRPLYAEFIPDTRTIAHNVIVGSEDWAGQLDANQQAFLDGWVERPAFRAAYDGLSNESYVDALMDHTGVSFSQSERDTLVNGLSDGTLTRATALRELVENERFVNAKRNQAFVMMEYFGYLRRDPDESGYQFWLNKLNQFAGNFEQAEMVKAFITSSEYRDRFH